MKLIHTLRQYLRTNRRSGFIAAAVSLLLPTAHPLLAAGFAESSALAEGHWVKIRVKEGGMHQITDAQLRQMGFSDPGKVAVCGYPATLASDYRLTSELPDDLPPVPVIRHGDKIIFYAESDRNLRLVMESERVTAELTRNYFADYATYFLTDSRLPVEPAQVPCTTSAADPLKTSYGTYLHDPEQFNTMQIGARLFGSDIKSDTIQKITFPLPGYNASAGMTMKYEMGIQPFSNSTVVIFRLPNDIVKTVGSKAVDFESCFYTDMSLNANVSPMKISRDDTYTTAIDFKNALNIGFGALDYFTVAYPRDNRLKNGQAQSMFVFTSLDETRNMEFTGAASSMMLWDVTDRTAPRAFETIRSSEGTVTVSAPGNHNIADGSGCAYVVAFDPDAQLNEVEFMETIPNQNLHASETPHMLIVAARNVLPQAERLAELHRRYDGIDVQVVPQEDVYNEFSSGTPHIMAIRRMASMYYGRDPRKFRSILLFGKASYDNRGITVPSSDFRSSYIPIFVCEDLANAGSANFSYATDAFVGMLDEDKSEFNVQTTPMTVNVGRIPTGAPSEAEAYIAKVEKRLSGEVVSAAPIRALLVSDDGNNNFHMADTDSLARIILANAPVINIHRAYNSIYPWNGKQPAMLNQRIKSLLTQGVGFMDYSGHSGPSALGENVWTNTMASQQENSSYPFTVFSSCRALYFDHEGPNIGSTMLFNPKGGAIAVVGALREVMMEHNRPLNMAIGKYYFSATPATTLGDVFRLAHNQVIEESMIEGGIRRLNNNLCYNLAGDPELRPELPWRNIQLTSVGDTEVDSNNATVELIPNSRNTLSGKVLDADGNTDETFNGQVFISLYDTPVTTTVINGSPADKVTIDENQISEKKLEVKAGRFTTDLYVPEPSIPDGKNRVTMYAISDNGISAGGVCPEITITGGDNESWNPDNSTTPVISAMYLNDPTFAEGDMTGSAVTLHAEVAPNEIGVSGSCTLLGRAMTLTLDGGRQSYDAASRFVAAEDGGGTLEFPITGLADGHHLLTLRVANYAGQLASRTISFTVVNQALEATLAIDEYPATTQAVVRLAECSLEPEARIVIKDATGNVVFATPADTPVSFPYTWNLKDSMDKDVPEGVYYLDAYLNAAGSDSVSYGTVKNVEIVVSRPD